VSGADIDGGAAATRFRCEEGAATSFAADAAATAVLLLLENYCDGALYGHVDV
jgi:hypothetical protein